jgi:2',3'-cyclic-nucleotide 2'-phosphodiesterase (5'-nucleotidase family)
MHRSLLRLPAVVLILLGSACATPRTQPPADAPAARGERTALVLAINDVYRIEGVEDGQAGGLPRVRTLREELERNHPDLLLLHGGDFLFPSFASRLFQGEQMIAVLNALDGHTSAFDDRMIAVLGNHELDKSKLADAAMLDKRIEDSQFTWLGANVDFRTGEDGRPLVESDHLKRTALVESGGIRIGIFGVTIPTAGEAYV